ncbi:ATP-dependent DNA helicase Q4-like protein [Dinothrombium tinctorium]|uniref:DNA 3'-5' helicase n=1 Tax=Dinothrombium tinctorium TaxID=1965070 RepID=A0A443RR12_9ACAR|nr:ATP-dependent DNA helicase Q4-like protein [Dinothrombium tinctorium]
MDETKNENASSNELVALKLQIKQWEKGFCAKKGRKPSKSDIDDNETIRRAYKRYWFLTKSTHILKENKVWGKQLNKQHNQDNRNGGSQFVASNKYANKLLKSFMSENIEARSNFSLKRKPKVQSNDDNNEKENDLSDGIVFEVESSQINEERDDNLKVQIDSIVADAKKWSLPEYEESTKSSLVSNHAIDKIIEHKDTSSNQPDSDSPLSSLFSSITSSLQVDDNDNCFFDSFGISLKRKSQDLETDEKSQNSNEVKNSDFKEADPFEFTEIDCKDNFDTNLTESKTKSRKKIRSGKVKEINVNNTFVEHQKRKKQKTSENFVKLNMKKKCFASKGYKKFNSKKYKYSKWKKLKKSYRCFNCGSLDHFAQECPLKSCIEEMREEELQESNAFKFKDDYFPRSVIPVKPVFSENEVNVDDILIESLYALGYKTFRENQKETIMRILSGKSTLFISPTGSGKSLCYQLSSYIFWKTKKCITLVVSPLISLMEDQLSNLPQCLKAVLFHSGLKLHEKQRNLNLIQQGLAQIVFLSPEMIVGNHFLDLSLLPPIAFVCIDEAHCLSEWSNNFRPSYLQLYKILKDKFLIKTFLALTATATKDTVRQIRKNLDIPIDAVIGEAKVPKNLTLTISCDVDKDQALIELLKSKRFINRKSIIVYCTRREITERIATLIRIEMQNIVFENEQNNRNENLNKKRKRYDARAYHAGLSKEERLRVQKSFLKGDLRVVVATIAFGMGINKSDVEGIIHYNLPRSFESYVQEIGRAGRNGSQAECHLFLDSNGYDMFELRRHIYANSLDKRNVRKLLEKVFKTCKCKKLINDETIESKTSSRSCPGHEVAFPLKETVLEVDATEETILTLLCFLQLNYKKFNIDILSNINANCKVLCYREGGKQMDAVAKTCPPLALALTLYKKVNKTDETPSMFTFSYVEIASMLGQSSAAVRKQLKSCEWETEPNGKTQRTNLRIQFIDLSFHLKTPGDLSDEEFDETVDFLCKYILFQENKEMRKLQNVYTTFRNFSQSKCTQNIDLAKSDELRKTLNNYFESETSCYTEWESESSASVENSSALKIPINLHQLFAADVCHVENARCCVREFIVMHNDQQLTSRAIARIFHGIGSPRFPVEVWNKAKRFWRSHINVDFNTIMKIANEELIRLRTQI